MDLTLKFVLVNNLGFILYWVNVKRIVTKTFFVKLNKNIKEPKEFCKINQIINVNEHNSISKCFRIEMNIRFEITLLYLSLYIIKLNCLESCPIFWHKKAYIENLLYHLNEEYNPIYIHSICIIYYRVY